MLLIFITQVKLAQCSSYNRLFTTKTSTCPATVCTLVTKPSIFECDLIGAPCFGCGIKIDVIHNHASFMSQALKHAFDQCSLCTK